MVDLQLLVIRTHDVRVLCEFYEAVGFVFTKEKHGSGPEHFSAPLGSGIFEIYPLSPSKTIDTATRLGFATRDLPNIIERVTKAGGQVTLEPRSTEWGTRAVVKDPDGRTVELYET